MNPEAQPRGELIRSLVGPAGSVSAAEAARIVPSPRGSQGSLPQAPAATISLTSLLRALRRRSALALGVALLLAAIAGPAAWFLIPRRSGPRPASTSPPNRPR